MENKLREIFDTATPRELDLLLGDLELDPPEGDTMERIRSEALAKAGLREPDAKRKSFFRRNWRPVAAAAACLAVLIAAAGGTYAYAAEVREYNAAVRFFDDYDLSTEGLSRTEIKAVYRDITTESFSYSKTAEVIENSLSGSQTGGFEIPQEDPTPEDVENLWNYWNFNGSYRFSDPSQAAQTDYRIRIEEKTDPERGLGVLDRCYFEKYQGEELVWRVSYTEFWIDWYVPVSDGVLVCGMTDTWSSAQTRYAWLSKIDEGGDILWTCRLYHGFQRESIEAVVENPDGSYAVFSRGEFEYFCLSQFDRDGRQTAFRQTDVGNYGIWDAARFGDGYIVQLGSYMTSEPAKIVKVDAEGNITDSFSYAAQDQHYCITDMMEFGGRLYLSAYAVPRDEENPDWTGGHSEIVSIVLELFEQNKIEISSEELTPMVRAKYTAVLLVCDPREGTPQEFYSVKGSLGGELALDGQGNLLWDVESITSTFFSPATSAFTIGGTSSVYRYTFDQDGALVSQEKTGAVTSFFR